MDDNINKERGNMIQFEKLLLSALLKDRQFLKETMGVIDDDIFTNQYLKYFYNILNMYYNKNFDTIPFDIFKYYLQKTIKTQQFAKEELPIISDLVIQIFNIDFDINFIKAELGEHIKKNKLRDILLNNRNFDVNNIGTLLEDIQNVSNYDPEEEKAMEYTSSLHLRSLRNTPIATLLTALDAQIGGGIAPGEFGLIAAQTGGCKSTFLLNFAWAAVMRRKKTLFITLEDSRDTVFQRFDSLFSNQEFILFRRDPAKSLNLKNKVLKHKDLLHVKDYSSGICTVSKIRSLVSGMNGIELIIVDYLDELGGAKRTDRWQEVEDSARQLKALANDLKIPIWTATQTSASSYGKEFVGLQHIYGGKGKAHISHIVLTVVQTDEERLNNKIRILISKQKAGPKGAVIECLVDLTKVRIFDSKLLP